MPDRFWIKPTQAALVARKHNAVQVSADVIRRRLSIASFGTAAVDIQDDAHIKVSVPGLLDQERLKRLASNRAKLGFHAVRPDLDEKSGGVSSHFVFMESRDPSLPEMYINPSPILTNLDVAEARIGFGFDNMPVINFRFDKPGAKRFATFTRDNVGRPVAIVIDDRILSAPVIREPILSGSGQISGGFTPDEAADLATQLATAPLPAPFSVISQGSTSTAAKP
jgi:SecD/SecF fusion protein